MQSISSNHYKNYTKSHSIGEGKLYSKLTIRWNYKEKHVDISMTGYIDKTVYKLQHSSNFHTQKITNQLRIPQYVTIIQYVPDGDTISELGKYEKKVQQIFGTLLYYVWAVDCTMLRALKKSHNNNINPQNAQRRASLRSQITQRHIPILFLDTKQVTW